MKRRPAVLVLLCAALLQPTPGAQTPAFEVASVKPSTSDNSTPLGAISMRVSVSAGRFIAANVPLRMLVGAAHEVDDARIIGGPSWQQSKRFDITAKADAAALQSPKDLPPFLRALLADRFTLKVHTETRDLPVHTLVVARSDGRLGRDIKPSTADCRSKPCSMTPAVSQSLRGGTVVRAEGQPLSALANLAAQAIGNMVKDDTGLTGLFDWELRFDPMSLMGAAGRLGVALPPGVVLPESDAPPLLAAIQEQLGLKVESVRRPVEVLVIDSAELPAPD